MTEEQERHPAAPPAGRLIVKRNGTALRGKFPSLWSLSTLGKSIPLSSAVFQTGSPDQKAKH